VEPTVLTIAGSDSSGGAGIQADLKAIAANGGYGASVITALTAQNTRGVMLVDQTSPRMVQAQLDSVFSDLDVAAVKTGMLASVSIIETVAAALREHRATRYVCDPVMVSKGGFELLPGECVDALGRELLPLAMLVTPNTREAEALTGRPVRTLAEAEAAGRAILERGPTAVLVKGGHLAERPGTDVLVARDGTERLEGEWIDTLHTHGTGCTYSAAIATWLARGAALREAVATAKAFVTEAIRDGLHVGGGCGPTNPFFFLRAGRRGREWVERVSGRTAAEEDR
jgi:hydroxymethylpyrimidine/phosphomethylpyrimidine kinase